LASREDLVGDEAAAALKGLQDRMEPFSHEQAMRILRDELGLSSSSPSGSMKEEDSDSGGDRKELVGAPGSNAPFTALSEAPVGAASLGQVYRGTLADGRAGTFHHVISQSKHGSIDDSHVAM
jgi:predicted unusual protein kinase regulating ubiquinone biosynthesis (AarF/ABC1/UbiB family)